MPVQDSFVPNSDFSNALITGRLGQLWLPPAVPDQVLKSLDATMITEWTRRQQLYAYYWAWFDGNAIRVTDPESDVPIYPLQINPIEWICLMHTGALFGELPDEDIENLVEFSFQNTNGKKDDACEFAKDVVDAIWGESSAAEIQLEGGLISQVTGGAVYKVSLVPGALKTYPLDISLVMNEYFFPIWDSTSKGDLLECWEVRYITPKEAEIKYGIKPQYSTQSLIVYLEHWTRDNYEITVDGKVPTMIYDDVEMPLKGKNPWGVVPYFYIPHLTRAGGYYGQSHIPGIVELAKEFNSRMADRGDKVKAQATDEYWMKNSSSGIKIRMPSPGTRIYDVGSNMQQGKDPDVNLMERSTITATGGKEFTDDLWRFIGHASATPAVAYGEDEGSQRSGMTLEIRFWPLTNHIRRERVMWSQGFARINRFMLMVLAEKGVYGVTDAHTKLRPKTEWNEILPRDRMDKVNEIVARAGVELISRRNAVTQLAKGEDVEQELTDLDADANAIHQREVEKLQVQGEFGLQQAKLKVKTQPEPVP